MCASVVCYSTTTSVKFTSLLLQQGKGQNRDKEQTTAGLKHCSASFVFVSLSRYSHLKSANTDHSLHSPSSKRWNQVKGIRLHGRSKNHRITLNLTEMHLMQFTVLLWSCKDLLWTVAHMPSICVLSSTEFVGWGGQWKLPSSHLSRGFPKFAMHHFLLPAPARANIPLKIAHKN